VIGDVVTAQDELDAHARRQTAAYLEEPPGSLAVPPVSYGFTRVAIEIELTAQVRSARTPQLPAALICRPVDAAGVSLYGRDAVASLRVRVDVSPRGVIPVKEDRGDPVASEEERPQ
jgi:hypothetical protein